MRIFYQHFSDFCQRSIEKFEEFLVTNAQVNIPLVEIQFVQGNLAALKFSYILSLRKRRFIAEQIRADILGSHIELDLKPESKSKNRKYNRF